MTQKHQSSVLVIRSLPMRQVDVADVSHEAVPLSLGATLRPLAANLYFSGHAPDSVYCPEVSWCSTAGDRLPAFLAVSIVTTNSTWTITKLVSGAV